MYFFVFGPPGEFTEWCTTLVAGLAGRAGPRDPVVIAADTLEALALQAIGTGSAQAVICSQRPGGRMLRALAQAGRNVLVAASDPRASLIELVLARGLELTEAVRLLASSCAALTGLARMPGALVLAADRDCAEPCRTAAAVARHLGLTLDDEAAAALAGQPVAGAPSVGAEEAIAWWNGLDAAQRRMATGALAPYLEPDPIAGVTPITWTGDLFTACDRPGQTAAAPIDITGRARRLIDGPDILLPAGTWSLTLTLTCSGDAAEHEFRVEVAAGRPLAAATLRPQAEGDTALRIDLDIDDATDHPVAIRIGTVRAAFDGAVSLVAAAFVRPVPAQSRID
jgi:hypothetical protein